MFYVICSKSLKSYTYTHTQTHTIPKILRNLSDFRLNPSSSHNFPKLCANRRPFPFKMLARTHSSTICRRHRATHACTQTPNPWRTRRANKSMRCVSVYVYT